MTEISEYFDAWSDIYDAELADNPGDDVAYYRELAERVGGPVLGVGCGTGRIYLDLLDDGFDATGIDVSSAMLERLREKATARDLEPDVRQADVTAFTPDREYGLVLAPADLILYPLTIEEKLAALWNLRSALAPGGRLVLEYFTPDFEMICEHYGTTMQADITYEGEPYTIETTITFADEVERIVTADKRLLASDGTVVTTSEATFTLLPKRQLELLLRQTGFETYSVYGGFKEQPLTDDSHQLVCVVHAP